MRAALPPGETGHPQSPDDEALARRIGTGADLFVLASMDDCLPCTLMKPIVRRLASRLSVELRLAEPTTTPGFLERHAVDCFPELMLWRDGSLLERRVGFHGFDDLDVFTRRALGRPDGPGETAQDIAFRTRIDEAQAAVDAMMAPASVALAPFMTAAGVALQALEARLRVGGSAGEMTAEEENRLRRAERDRIYAPFQDRIDALRDAQAKAMRLYDEATDRAVQACAASPSGLIPPLVCSPDDSVCGLASVERSMTTP